MDEARVIAIAALLVGFLFFSSGSSTDLEGDREALVEFATLVPHRYDDLNWNPFTSICHTWTGVSCNSDGSRVIAIHLSGMGLSGVIPPNTLSRLTALQILNLHSNTLSGSFPSEITNLSALIEVRLQFNSFSGPLPFDFSVWRNLSVVDLSYNFFNGSIPSSIANLTRLGAFNLSNNMLTGSIPDLSLPSLTLLDFSNNHLEGVVPDSLLRFPNSSFSGNNLYSTSFPPVCPPPSSNSTGSESKQHIRSALVGIIVGGCVLGLIMVIVLITLLTCCLRGKTKYTPRRPIKTAKVDRSLEKVALVRQDEVNKLVFFEGCTFNFDLEDLLRASAEVLGKGTYGMAYKAVLEDSTNLVVKRIKDVAMGKREFEQQMELVGNIKHENLMELRAYYYSKDEKLMVYDYYSLGSVFSMLHGNRGAIRAPLDWEARLSIAIGAARGLTHIHSDCGGRLVHGNIKSSNVFLNHHFYGCISDLGGAALINQTAVPISRTAGYRAPEVVEICKPTQMSDVYSFGVLLLELLTGKSPIQVIGSGDDVLHLVRWVQSVVREEWTAEVFDVELMRFPNIEEELVEMLQIAMSCVSRVPEERPKMSEVVRMISDVRRLDTSNQSSPDEASSEVESIGTPPAPAHEEGSSSLPSLPSLPIEQSY